MTNDQRTKIIALTASAFEEDRAGILAAGCDDFVSKPFQEAEIFEKITQHLGVCYSYEENRSSSYLTQDSWVSSTEVETLLRGMSPEWIDDLHRAAVTGSDQRIFQLLCQIPPDQNLLKAKLTDWANNFCFDQIQDLIQRSQP